MQLEFSFTAISLHFPHFTLSKKLLLNTPYI